MTMPDGTFPWLSLLLLGAVHGINPAMGWLFAVARALQERNRRALWRALGPLALGHALAVATALAVALTL
jgi:threonine/homoserine/homoserine lactone efflux protein